MKEILKTYNYEKHFLNFNNLKPIDIVIPLVIFYSYKLLDKAITNGYNLSLDFKNLKFILEK